MTFFDRRRVGAYPPPMPLLPAFLLALPQSVAPVDSFTVPIVVPSQGDTLRGFLRVAAGPGPHLTVVQFQGFPGAGRPTLPAKLQATPRR